MSNTGYKAYTNLEKYYIDNGIATGVTKPNSVSDPDYVAPVYDTNYCPLPSVSPSPTPTVTVTPSITPTVTPSVTPSISLTPSISTTPSVTPTVSITPTINVTPSVTPSPSPSTPKYYYYVADRYVCINGYCSYAETIPIANLTPLSVDYSRYYSDSINGYIFTNIVSTTSQIALITNISGSGTKTCSSLCGTGGGGNGGGGGGGGMEYA